MRRFLIQIVLPFCFCLLPILAAALVAVCIPGPALSYYVEHFHPMDALIVGLGLFLFAMQMIMCWRALRWQGTSFNEGADRWISHLAQAAEWFPMLGLLGTVGGILQTFAASTGTIHPNEISPAITATGSGLFMALINILPTWIVMIGRDLILTLSGSPAEATSGAPGHTGGASP